MNCETCGKSNAKEKRIGPFGSLYLCEEHSNELDGYLSLSPQEKSNKIKEVLTKRKRTLLSITSIKELMIDFESGGWRFNLPLHPRSSQSEKKLKEEFKQLISEEIKNRKLNRNYQRYEGRNIFLDIGFFITKRYEKDVDNMIKILFDCIKNELFGDDIKIKKCCTEKFIVDTPIKENILIKIKLI